MCGIIGIASNKPVSMNIINSLKKDSIFIIITPNSDSKARIFFKNCWSGYHAPRHKMIFNISNIEQAFNKCKSIDLDTHKMHDPFTNIISFMNLCKELKNSFSLLRFLKLIISFFFSFQEDFIFVYCKKSTNCLRDQESRSSPEKLFAYGGYDL